MRAALAVLFLILPLVSLGQAPAPDAGVADGFSPDELEGLSAEEREALGILETVEVTARRLQVDRIAGSAHVVPQEALETYEHDDVHQVLAQVPGVYVRDEDGFGLRPNIGLRGASSDRSSKVTLMEDGILLGPAPYSAPAAYYFPLVTRMVGVDVFKGPASIRHGPQTLGGAVNLRTREVPEEGGEGGIDLAGGSYWLGKAHLHYGYGAARFGALVEGVYLRTSGFKDLDGGGDTGFAKGEAMLKAFYRLPELGGAAHRLELKLGVANETSHETYLGLSDADFQATPLRRYAASQLDRMEWLRSQAQLAWVLEGGPDFDLRITAYRHDFGRAWRKLNGFREGPSLEDVLRNADAGQTAALAAILRGEADSTTEAEALMLGTNDRRYVSQGVQAVGHWRPVWGGIAHAFEAGARLHYDRIERLHTELAHRMIGGEMEEEGSPEVTTAQNRGSALAGALHLLDEILLGDFLLVPGARAELIRTVSTDRLSGARQEGFNVVLLPGVGVVYQPAESWSLLAGVHQGFSPVSPGQPEEVLPEQSLNAELGGRYAAHGLELDAIGFLNRYFNLVGECTFSTGCADELLNRQFNGGAALVYGAELSAAGAWAGPLGTQLVGRVAYTLTLTEFLSSFDSENPQFGRVEAGDALPYVPVHQAAAIAQVNHPRWSASLSARFIGQMREEAGQGPLDPLRTTDPQFVLDAAVFYQLFPKTRLYATGDNLLNAQSIASRRPFGARPIKPIHGEVGIKHEF